MPNMNFDILKGNISNLMKENNMTQQQLGDVIGMSQSNVNKCLKSGDSSRCFTLEQVCTIADYFGKSVDELVGRSSNSNALSPETICEFLSNLISHYTVVHFDHKVEEEEWIPMNYDTQIEKKTITYDAFYFPNYVTPPSYFDEYRMDDLESEARANGNDSPSTKRINNFLQKFIETFEKHDSGVYDDETYEILIDAYRKALIK